MVGTPEMFNEYSPTTKSIAIFGLDFLLLNNSGALVLLPLTGAESTPSGSITVKFLSFLSIILTGVWVELRTILIEAGEDVR